MGTARPGLARWPISSSERAAMQAAKDHVERILRGETTPADTAQAYAALQALNNPRQPALPLEVPR